MQGLDPVLMPLEVCSKCGTCLSWQETEHHRDYGVVCLGVCVSRKKNSDGQGEGLLHPSFLVERRLGMDMSSEDPLFLMRNVTDAKDPVLKKSREAEPSPDRDLKLIYG